MDSARDPELKPLRNITISVTAETNVGGRPYMEDFFAVELKANEESQKHSHLRAQAYVGIFDGHGGKEAAKYARDRLWQVIQSQPKFKLTDPEVIKEGLCEAYEALHQEMEPLRASWKRHKTGELSTAGTTASTVIFRGDHIFVANVGDSTAVLAVTNPNKDLEGQHPVKALQLTKDHKPGDPNEINNIRTLGGSVKKGKKGIARVVWERERLQTKGVFDGIPFLGVSRSLGDFWSFSPRTRKFTVSPRPDVYVHKINLEQHKFLVIASDGLWNVMSPDEVVQFIWDYQNKLPINDNNGDGQKKDVVKAVIDRALEKWAGKFYPADNIAVLIAFLSETGTGVTTQASQHKTILNNEQAMAAVSKGTGKAGLVEDNRVEVRRGDISGSLCADSIEIDGVSGCSTGKETLKYNDSTRDTDIEEDSGDNPTTDAKLKSKEDDDVCFNGYYDETLKGCDVLTNSQNNKEDVYFDAVSELSDFDADAAKPENARCKSAVDSTLIIKRSDTLPVENVPASVSEERPRRFKLGKRETTEEVHHNGSDVAASMNEDSNVMQKRPQRFRLGKHETTEEVCPSDSPGKTVATSMDVDSAPLQFKLGKRETTEEVSENIEEEHTTPPKLKKQCPGLPTLKRCGRYDIMDKFFGKDADKTKAVDVVVEQNNGPQSAMVIENDQLEHKLNGRPDTPPVKDVPDSIEDSESLQRFKLGKRRSTEETCPAVPMLKRFKAIYCPNGVNRVGKEAYKMEDDQDSGVHCDDPSNMEDTPTADVVVAADGEDTLAS